MKLNYILVLFCLLLFWGVPFLNAANKKLVVYEKSNTASDKTNHNLNKNNLPSGAQGIEAMNLADAATKILAKLGLGDCIEELHFRGHGSAGKSIGWRRQKTC